MLQSFHKQYCMMVFLVKLSFRAEIIEKIQNHEVLIKKLEIFSYLLSLQLACQQ